MFSIKSLVDEVEPESLLNIHHDPQIYRCGDRLNRSAEANKCNQSDGYNHESVLLWDRLALSSCLAV